MNSYRFRVLETTDIHAYIEDYDYYTDNPKNQGLVYVKTAADQARQELLDLGYPEESIMHLDAGDLIQGSPLGNFLVEEAYTPSGEFGTGTWSVEGADTTNQNPIYGSLGQLGVDASALGNHEFNFGLDYLYSSIANTGDVTVLNGNVFNDPDNTRDATPDEHSFIPYTLLNVLAYNSATGASEEVTIGVAGFVTEGIMGWDARNLVGEVYTEKVANAAAAVAEEMRAAGADLLFAITHTDHGDVDDAAFAEYEHDASLGVAKVDTDGDGEPDYDALFGGHEHKRSNATPLSPLDETTGPDSSIGYAEPFTDFADGIPSELNGVPFLMSGSWGDTLGVMDIFLTKDANGTWDIADHEVGFIDIKGQNDAGQTVPQFEADPDLRNYIAPWHEGTIAYMNQPVAKISTAMSSYFAHGFDDPMLELFAEIQIDYGKQAIQDQFTNEGQEFDGVDDLPVLSVATGYKGGREGGTDYTVIDGPEMLNKDVASLYIYDNNVASIVQVTGAELEDYLEYSAFQAYNTIDPNSPEPQVLNKVPKSSRGYNVDFVKGENGALTYQVDVTQEPEFDENGPTGNEGRIINLKYNGEPVQDSDSFYLVMNNYRSNGGGNYPIDWAQKDADGLLYLSPDANQKIFADFLAAAEGVVDTSLPNGEPTFSPVVGGDDTPTEVVYITSNEEDAQTFYGPRIGATYLGDYENAEGVNDINGKSGFANYSITLEPAKDHSGIIIDPAHRFATFNVALNRSSAGELISDLEGTDNTQAQTLAEIIQRVNPDVLFLNEIDFDDEGVALDRFLNSYLAVSQAEGLDPVEYPYVYLAESNTGIQSGFDLDNDGQTGGPGDAFGFGFFPGQFAMAFVSKYPILEEEVRTFQQFLWKDMPDALLPDDPNTPEPADWFSPEELEVVRLSSKSHWDIPVQLPSGEVVHVLGSHPTPPVFDGPEDRNGRRNHDEIRFWSDYITPNAGDYIYDDEEFAAAGNTTPESPSGGLAPSSRFVIVGDQNADPFDGDSTMNAARQFTENPLLNNSVIPSSEGGVDASERQGGINLEHVGNPTYDTGDFNDASPGNLRVDYVLPSNNLEIKDASVFWPTVDDPLFNLVGDFDPTVEPEGFPSSDHRMVYADLLPIVVSDGSFELQILHTSDQEAGIAAFNDAPGLSAVLNALEDDYENTLKLSSGDLYIAGPFFSASTDIYEEGFPGVADILIQNELGWDAAAVGNHEFDAGDQAFFKLVAPNPELANGSSGGQGIGEEGYLGTLFPYLATNLDYSEASLPDGLKLVESGNAPVPNSLTASVVVDVNGEPVGVLGAVTPYLPTIANIGDVQMLTGDSITPSTAIAEQVSALIENLTPEVEKLTSAGINKVVLMTHLQEAEIEQALAQALADNNIPVDVLIGGGSHRVMASEDDALREDETQQTNGQLLEPYPQVFTAGGNTVYYMNTDANYRYLSQLVVTFDENGVITEIGDDSGTYATDISGVDRLYDTDITSIEEVKAVADSELVAIVEGVQGFVNNLDGDIFGQTDVYLNGIRGDVRTQETNLGNLAADAQDFYAEEYLKAHGGDLLPGFESIDISFKNGGGIRDQIGQSFVPGGGGELVQLPPAANPEVGKEEGDISALDISNSLRFDNALVVGTTTAAGVYSLFEHAVSGVEITSGRFAQISGIQYSFDPAATPRSDTAAGERIQNLVVLNEDGSIKDVVVEDGELVGDPDREFSITTLQFLAEGGDGYPNVISDQKLLSEFSEPQSLGAANLASGGEQDALAEYLSALFNKKNGQQAFMEADTERSADERIQNVAFRDDTILEGVPSSPEPLLPEFGSLEGETIDIVTGNQLVFAGAGNDLLLATESVGGNTIFAGSGDDVAVLGAGDTYFGNAGDDRFFAQTGGNNILNGGAGSDQFWISSAELPEAPNTIQVFTIGEDLLGVAGIGASFETLSITQTAAGATIAFGPTDLARLNGIQATDLTAMNFVFG